MFKQMSRRLVENPKIRDILKYFPSLIFDFFVDFVMYVEELKRCQDKFSKKKIMKDFKLCLEKGS